MPLFSKRQQTATPPEPTSWTMSKEEYEELKSMLSKALSNIDVIDDNVRLAISRLDALQKDMKQSINNEIIIDGRLPEMAADLKQIKRVVNS